MKTRKLGQSDLNISRIGIGAWAIGGGQWEFGWGAQDDAQSMAAIRAGLDLGINWIDTAAAYGLGHSETVVGRAAQGLLRRPYIFTKCSLVWDETRKTSHNLQAASIRRECEASLQRLGMDAIDLYQIHWPAWQGGPESASPGSIEEAVAELAKLKDEGKNPQHRRFEFQRRANAAGTKHCSNCFPAAALLTRCHRRAECDSSVCTQAENWRYGLFADGIGSVDRSHDP